MNLTTLSGISGLFAREMKKWFRQRVQIVFAFVIPLMWLTLFGKSFNITYFLNLPEGIPPDVKAIVQKAMEEILLRVFGSLDYFNFFAVGMLSVFALFTSMWSGMSLVFDRRLGYLERFLVAPIPRESIYLAKVFSALAKGLIQFTIMLLITFALGLTPKQGFTAIDMMGLYMVIAGLILALSAIFTAIAIRITSHDTVISIANLVNIPLMFTSNAIFPLEQMPDWMRVIAAVNPLTHSITLTRYLVLGIGSQAQVILSTFYLAGFTAVCVFLGVAAARRYL